MLCNTKRYVMSSMTRSIPYKALQVTNIHLVSSLSDTYVAAHGILWPDISQLSRGSSGLSMVPGDAPG